MFNKLSLLAALAPLVAGLQLQIPENPTSGGTVTINWTSEAGDQPTFSFELVNEVFHNAFAIANNVMPELGSITITLPIVPVGAGYTLEAVNVGNINDVFASTGSFSIGPNAASTVSPASSGSSTGTSATRTSAGSVTGTAPTNTQTSTPLTLTTPFGTTLSQSTPTGSDSTSGTSDTSAPSSTASSAASAPLKLNSNVGAFAAVVFSAIAGAAIVAL